MAKISYEMDTLVYVTIRCTQLSILRVKQACEIAHTEEKGHVTGSKNSALRISNHIQFLGNNSLIFGPFFNSSPSFELRITVRF